MFKIRLTNVMMKIFDKVNASNKRFIKEVIFKKSLFVLGISVKLIHGVGKMIVTLPMFTSFKTPFENILFVLWGILPNLNNIEIQFNII